MIYILKYLNIDNLLVKSKNAMHTKNVNTRKSIHAEINSATVLRAYYFDSALKMSDVMTAIHKH